MTLSDKSGEVRATVLQFDEDFYHRLNNTNIIRLWGFVETKAKYRGQVVIEKFIEVDEPADLDRFLQPLPESHQQNAGRLRDLVHSVVDPWLSKLLLNVFRDDKDTWRRYSKAVAAKMMHHDYRGGLLEHSVEVASLCLAAAANLGKINRDLLVAGALFHDVGKLDEIEHGLRKGEYTKNGNLVGHVVTGMYRIRTAMDEIENFPEDLKDDLCHLILSHHGSYEYGAARLPSTPEAVILACCDVMSARVYQLNDSTQKVRDHKLLLPSMVG